MKLIAETCIIGGSYILISASLIAFNKYLMTHERRSTLFSLCRRCMILFYSVCLNLRVHVGVNSKECRAFPSSKSHDGNAHADDLGHVSATLHCRAKPLSNDGKSA